MPKRLLLLSAVAFALVYWGAGTKCMAQETDVSALFEQAGKYEKDKNYVEAEAIYKAIVQDYPSSDDALTAEEKLVVLYIVWDKEAEAEAAYQQLLTDFCEREGIAKAVDHVGDAYRESEKYEKALEVYRQVVDSWAEDEHAIGSQTGIARVYVSLGDGPNAEIAIAKLIVEFADHNDIADAVYEIADEYREVKKYEKALGFYKQIVDSWPESEEAMDSQEDVAKLYIELGDDPNAEAAVEKLIAKFADRDEIADAVDEMADEYKDAKKYDKALELYKYVVKTWPDSEQAMGSQADVAKLYIELGDDPNAEAAVDKLKLIAEFGDRDGEAIADAVDEVADAYREVKKYEKALELYQYYVVDNGPEANGAMWAQAGIAMTYIAAGDDPNTQGAIDKLVTKFSGNPDLPYALDEVEEMYEERRRYDKAKEICQQIIRIDANSSEARKAVLDIRKLEIMSLIEAGNDADAAVGIDKLVADFNDHSALPKVIYEIGRKYQDDACRYEGEGLDVEAKVEFQKAVTTWQIITGIYRNSAVAPRAFYAMSDCYRKLDERVKAIECYEEILGNWPDYGYAWSAQFHIGYCYEQLKHAGAVPASIADAKTKVAYERVVEEYPDCPAAEAARDWLNCRGKCECK